MIIYRGRSYIFRTKCVLNRPTAVHWPWWANTIFFFVKGIYPHPPIHLAKINHIMRNIFALTDSLNSFEFQASALLTSPDCRPNVWKSLRFSSTDLWALGPLPTLTYKRRPIHAKLCYFQIRRGNIPGKNVLNVSHFVYHKGRPTPWSHWGWQWVREIKNVSNA